ncbi:hypothetical protein Molly5_26 [Maribacter phage Molly_5]|uniref:Uncharacterized protein n=1 Tax=Maribacter phage Molly_1 TaxID=2745685 RepID=A0A8E4UYB6_9CAUD|nr:hypothetical protein M1M29_gp026 [Maribacter phage Molly_1]QQO97707.1 hypothetical protein Molly2_26 [Maribacter phage Molly_2]QQO97907.1 hypothetical protein Molly3_26 [Maribacter phage Molly_3]QQO98107.1 hypothetical protein Molly4_26 [Maribacter phage Molly_4]QQO98307.1 hypothetical protein Molly5_26 [Maribacter phage Molly_5]QQO97507.1 hypothetical protein Molly1_26 [Maribacter phage Molly_1]
MNLKTLVETDKSVDDILVDIFDFNILDVDSVYNSLYLQPTLNPSIWDGLSMRPEVRKRLLAIAYDFFNSLGLNKPDTLKDITLTGSSSNYNWSSFSDIDLHLRLDFSQISDDTDFVKELFLGKKTIWNAEHNIKIFDIPVEVYIENIGDTHIASGLFSVLNNSWIVTPVRTQLSVDKDDVISKVEGFTSQLPYLIELFNSGSYPRLIETITKIKDKIATLRQSGLIKTGEFGVENLTFKILRRGNFISSLNDLSTRAFDLMMGLD